MTYSSKNSFLMQEREEPLQNEYGVELFLKGRGAKPTQYLQQEYDRLFTQILIKERELDQLGCCLFGLRRQYKKQLVKELNELRSQKSFIREVLNLPETLYR